MSNVESYLKATLKKKKALLFVLIDSEISEIKSTIKLAKEVEKIGASAILVGGSSATDQKKKKKKKKKKTQSCLVPF